MLRHDPRGGWVFGGERLELSTKAFNTIKSLITVLGMLPLQKHISFVNYSKFNFFVLCLENYSFSKEITPSQEK